MRIILLASVAVAGFIPASAWAQARNTDRPATEAEIVVTAQGRSEQLQDVPMAISAVTAETLQNSGVNDVRQLNQVSPSLLVSGASSETSFSARIRGIGTVGENIGLESSVGLMVDGIYRARTGVGLTELGEIERIEVLRGPQGTLFGRNSTAGLINVITAAPKFKFGGYASATYGNYNAWRLDGGVTGPISETLAARIDGVWQKRDGFLKSVTPGEPGSYDRDRWMVRGQLLFQPTSDISLRLIGDYTKRDENCCSAVYIQPIRDLAAGPGGTVNILPSSFLSFMQLLGANIQFPPAGERFGRTFSNSAGFPAANDVRDWGLSGELTWDFGGAKLTAITAYRDFFTRQGLDADYTALDIVHRTRGERELTQFTQELRLQGKALDDRLDWLVGGYFGKEHIKTYDNMQFGKDFELFGNCFVAATLAGRGLGTMNTTLPTCSTLPSSVWPGFFGRSAQFGAAPLTGTGANGSTFDYHSQNFALFTHNVIQIVPDKLALTVGLRYTWEEKTLTGDFRHTNDLCPILQQLNSTVAGIACFVDYRRPSITRSDPGSQRKENQLTGTAVLSYKPVEDVLLYGSFSRGYKAGGYNLDTASLDPLCGTTAGGAAAIATCQARLALPANTVGNGRAEAIDLQFAAEKVDAYEVGLKYNGPGIDVNLAAFYSAFSDFQLNTFNGVTFEVTNIMSCRDNLNGADTNTNPLDGGCLPNRLRPGVTSKGFELEIFAHPARNLSVNLGLTYADTKYRSNLTGTAGRPLPTALFQLPGQQMSNAPRYVVTSGISYTPQLGDSGLSALFYLNGRLQSDVNTGSNLDLEKVQDAFFVMNARVGLYGPDKRWGVELWAQNLLDTQYLQIAAGAPAQGSGTWRAVAMGNATSANQLFMGFPGEPRTYGVTVRTRF